MLHDFRDVARPPGQIVDRKVSAGIRLVPIRVAEKQGTAFDLALLQIPHLFIQVLPIPLSLRRLNRVPLNRGTPVKTKSDLCHLRHPPGKVLR
jgi:hypothetical protein